MGIKMQHFPQQQPANANPLSKLFRQPAIYIGLPSGGAYWPNGALQMPETGEIPVFPMTSKDEIILRTPDALINGQGMVDVMQSCCPNIKNAWQMPATDVDAVLIAIRIASYGHQMDFESKCPHCNEMHTYGMDLRSMLEAIRAPRFDQEHALDSLLIKFRPQAYFGVNKTSKISFEINKLGQAIDAMEDDEARVQEAIAQMNRLVDLNLEVLTSATDYVAVSDNPEQKVYDKSFILDFYKNIDSKTVTKIQEMYGEESGKGAVPPQQTTCAGCSESITIAVTFDYANFFAPGS
jgi:hypothetical protein